nr:MAG TPA: hypothetical protein [Caudoviricetes sp.]
MARAKWVHSPPIKYFMASFDLVSSSRKLANAPHSSQANTASTPTQRLLGTLNCLVIFRNLLTTSEKQSTNPHTFRPTLAQSFAVSDAPNQEPYKFLSQSSHAKAFHIITLSNHTIATVKEILTVEFLLAHAIKSHYK